MKLALFCDLNVTSVYYNSVLLIKWTLCQICLFEFIWVKGSMKFMKRVKGGGVGASSKRLGTSAVY
jgi:hypothetical protein